ncbi:hypothetical protein RJ55_06113 [Drechmeria coniospora]|nr:hypothetical protein RJ55_06113 [Drechmeria coniospora]
MRPPRITILVLFFAASIFIVCRALTSPHRRHASSYGANGRSSRSLFGLMYYNTPFSLFPPNAAISLTDDNSTSFAARPAAFGPRLASAGLSGQLWVGSGFAEDSLDGNGELGCSDLPGWDGGLTRASMRSSFRHGPHRLAASQAKSGRPKRRGRLLASEDGDAAVKGRSASTYAAGADDNTDEHLNDKAARSLARRDASSSHADIQSLQEAAEIEGKIVLLMRGGCGFLEKVLWAQRRGAVAVIVGDNQKGGPLIQMFAHGDEVDNVTVPSVFTARTTAHLLSSLTQPGSFIEDTLDDNGNPVFKVQQGPRAKHERTKRSPAPARAARFSRRAPLLSSTTKAAKKRAPRAKAAASTTQASRNRGWFSIFRWGRSARSVEDWTEDREQEAAVTHNAGSTKNPKSNHDDFVIGVQDWRDPDLVDKSRAKDQATVRNAPHPKGDAGDARKPAPEANGPKGGSITPGSGEYNPSKVPPKDGKDAGVKSGSASAGSAAKGHGLMSKLFGDEGKGKNAAAGAHPYTSDDAADGLAPPGHGDDAERHQGLWVTITPTSSASPFFDTLLVLVISPLVTLTVVYALLVARARIRRRRWRAPKSVVERLPVRTYHTVTTSPAPSPRLPASSSATPTTPLLQQQQQQQQDHRSRPRSRTTTGVLESENFFTAGAAIPTPQSSNRASGRPEVEKGAAGLSAEWRKHMGRQVECVVCLEEYVDGVSRVMSLPCGHEFHADCITPWLTTRRRTCPICKGDVVRSLAHSSRSGPRYDAYLEDSDEELDLDAPSSSLDPGPDAASRLADGSPDPEQGHLLPRTGDDRPSRPERWFGLLPHHFTANRSPRPEDRDR